LESDIVSPSQLLSELRNSYQALASDERKQVTAFLSELSWAAMKSPGEQRGIHLAGRLA
jgi:hypothetical protein